MSEPEPDPADRIAPVAYRPPEALAATRGLRAPSLWLLLGPALAVSAAILWYLVTARAVTLDVVPAPDELSVKGGIGLSFGGHRLLHAGDYTVSASKAGYRDLNEAFTVGAEPTQTFHWELARLPGHLTVQSKPAAEVTIDGTPRGTTPLADVELAPGSHRLVLRAARYQVYESEVAIEGGGTTQTVSADLLPGWAPVTVTSSPPQAELLVDGVSAGRTPVTAEVGAGNHELALQLAGYKTWHQPITVKANEPQTLAEVQLGIADTRLHVTSIPAGATVAVDGSYRGQTPLDLPLAPGVDHRLDLSAPGYKAAQRTVQLQRDAGADLDVRLEPILGTVIVAMTPADATLSVDGKAQPAGTTHLELTAIPHRVEARKSGFEPFSTTVTPRPSFEQRVEIALTTAAEKKASASASRITAAGGMQLVLVQPGTFRMGSERGTQGRQSNEAIRPVKLTRAFYLGATEVTNAQFKQFEPGHSSGIVARETLDNDTQPVVRISWEQAAKFCNWLSAKDGLPAAYKEDGATMTLIEPVATGYRLPTEAEWEWAARFAGNSVALRYPWGSSLPPPPGAGNYADAKAGNLAGTLIAGYDDGYAAAAPVGKFAPNALGIFDLGGNVAEWTNDRYDPTFMINPPQAEDPLGAKGGNDHVIRGASWQHGRVIELRLAFRDAGHDERMDVGFRVARYAN